MRLIAIQSAEWDRDQARQLMISWIKQYLDFDAVFAVNDDMVLGAIDAMSAAGIRPSTKVTIGLDGSSEALRSIKAGVLGATVDTVPAKQARQAVEYLMKHLRDKAMPPQRVMLVTPELITKASPPRG